VANLVYRDFFEILESLPKICAVRHPHNNRPIVVRRGIRGYWPLPPHFDVDGWNARRGITAAQVAAMEIGSVFGFFVPGADPLNH